MKKYLIFQTDGIISERETNSIDLINNNYNKYIFKNNYYILLIDNTTNKELNISKIPFNNQIIYGDIKMYRVNNFIDFKLKSLSENFYIKFINNIKEYIDYSSDDFNPDTCDKNNTC